MGGIIKKIVRVVAAAACGVLIAACQGQRVTQVTDSCTQVAETIKAEFTVARSNRQIEVLTRDGAKPSEVQSAESVEAAAIAIDRVALLGSGRLGIIDSAGRGTSIAVPDCFALAPAGSRIRALCGAPEARDLTVRVFDNTLTEVSRTAFMKQHQRSNAAEVLQGEAAPGLVAAGVDAFWLESADRHGFMRSGARLIAKYDYGGNLLSSVRVDGVVYHSAVSPDGRYLAMLLGGSGGACDTVANLRVLDLSTMKELNTAPDTPPSANQLDARGEIYFSGESLFWQSPVKVAALGLTKGAACEPAQFKYWRRTFDVAATGIADEPIAAADAVRPFFLGPDCADVFTPTATSGIQIIYAGAKPERCGP